MSHCTVNLARSPSAHISLFKKKSQIALTRELSDIDLTREAPAVRLWREKCNED